MLIYFIHFINIRLTVGESFFQVSEDEAIQQLDRAKTLTEDMLSKHMEEYESLRIEMEALKKTLYSKFGSSINLEDK